MPGVRAPERPDWRWMKTVELGALAQKDVRRRFGALASDDKVLSELFAFYQATKHELGHRYPVANTAFNIYNNNVPVRALVEGYILTGASNEEIASAAACLPEDIQLYHDAFFEVRPWLGSKLWITATLFQGAPHRMAHTGSIIGMAHRIAWIGGKEMLDCWLSYDSSDEMKSKVEETIRDILRRQAFELSITAGSRSDQAPDIINLVVNNSSAVVANQASKQLTDGANLFLNSVSKMVSVASPVPSTNLSIEAREKRTHEYEAELVK